MKRKKNEKQKMLQKMKHEKWKTKNKKLQIINEK